MRRRNKNEDQMLATIKRVRDDLERRRQEAERRRQEDERRRQEDERRRQEDEVRRQEDEVRRREDEANARTFQALEDSLHPSPATRAPGAPPLRGQQTSLPVPATQPSVARPQPDSGANDDGNFDPDYDVTPEFRDSRRPPSRAEDHADADQATGAEATTPILPTIGDGGEEHVADSIENGEAAEGTSDVEKTQPAKTAPVANCDRGKVKKGSGYFELDAEEARELEAAPSNLLITEIRSPTTGKVRIFGNWDTTRGSSDSFAEWIARGEQLAREEGSVAEERRSSIRIAEAKRKAAQTASTAPPGAQQSGGHGSGTSGRRQPARRGPAAGPRKSEAATDGGLSKFARCTTFGKLADSVSAVNETSLDSPSRPNGSRKGPDKRSAYVKPPRSGGQIGPADRFRPYNRSLQDIREQESNERDRERGYNDDQEGAFSLHPPLLPIRSTREDVSRFHDHTDSMVLQTVPKTQQRARTSSSTIQSKTGRHVVPRVPASDVAHRRTLETMMKNLLHASGPDLHQPTPPST